MNTWLDLLITQLVDIGSTPLPKVYKLGGSTLLPVPGSPAGLFSCLLGSDGQPEYPASSLRYT